MPNPLNKNQRLDRALLALLPFFILGLILGRIETPVSGWMAIPAFGTACLLIIQAWRQDHARAFTTGLVLLLVGASLSYNVYRVPTSKTHVQGFVGRNDTVFGGIVAQRPVIADGRTRMVVNADEVLSRGVCQPATGKIGLTIAGYRRDVRTGDRVRFPTVLREIRNFGNPGVFDYRKYQQGRGIRVSGWLKHPNLLMLVDGVPRQARISSWIDGYRNKAAVFLDKTVDTPARGWLKAVLLGIRDDGDEKLLETLRVLGLAHLLAISGLHVGVAALVSYFIIRRALLLAWPRSPLFFDINRVSALGSMIPVVLYTLLAGARPPTIRAAVMVGVFILARWIGRPKDHMTALAAAAWIVLIIRPADLFTASFQLSFTAAMAIILLISHPIFLPQPTEPFEAPDRVRPGLKRRLLMIAGITLAAFLGTSPIAAYHFHRVPLLALPANVIFTPLISVTMIIPGLFGLLLIPVSAPAAGFVFHAIEYLLAVYLRIMAVPAETGPNVMVCPPGPIFFICYYALLVTALWIRPWSRAFVTAALITGFYLMVHIVSGLSVESPKLSLTVLDVGQGGAVHATMSDRTQMMIDGGGFPGSSFDTGEQIIAPYLLHKGIRTLDIITLTHAQSDHAEGLPYLARNFFPSEVWTNNLPSRNRSHRTLMALAVNGGMLMPTPAELHLPRTFGKSSVRILSPPGDVSFLKPLPTFFKDPNEASLVLQFRMGNRAFIVPGDIGQMAEHDLTARYGGRLRSDVLVAPHHGSAGALTSEFLKAVSPKVVIFSVGRYNRFGFPSPEAMARVEAIGADVYRTDIHGAITVETDGRELQVRTFEGDGRIRIVPPD